MLSTEIVDKKRVTTNEKEDHWRCSNPIFFDSNKKVWIYVQLWSNGILGVESIAVYESTGSGFRILLGSLSLNDADID